MDNSLYQFEYNSSTVAHNFNPSESECTSHVTSVLILSDSHSSVCGSPGWRALQTALQSGGLCTDHQGKEEGEYQPP